MITETEQKGASALMPLEPVFDGLIFRWPETQWRERFYEYKPNIIFCIERSNYIIKIAENKNELEEIFRLRHSVFYEEKLAKKKINNIDIDRFDMMFDHLLILDKRLKKIVGTYRINSSIFNDEYYSGTEFDIRNISGLVGRKLELGRACIHKNYRNSVVLSLLWKGLWEYVTMTFTRYVFGCSSIMTVNRQESAAIYMHLMREYGAGDDLMVFPREKFRIENFNEQCDYASALVHYADFNVKELVPPLLNLYLKFGAKICGEPAFDKEMRCMDFFTFLDLTRLNDKAEEILLR